jgi:hypothetical protein
VKGELVMIRAKMHCDAVREYTYAATDKVPETKYCEEVRLSAVYGKDGSANAQWSKSTPSGSVNLTITNPDAWGKIKQGRFYFVDVSEATEDS